MTSALTAYLADGGADYIASPEYEARRLALADKMSKGKVSFAEAATTLGLPLAVVIDLFNSWQVEKAAAKSVKH